jgi:glycosyltransferase involved in cell wall biosynthesis
MNKPVTIIILTWNGIEYTKKCLETLHNNLDYEPVEVVVVDNNSTDGTIEYLAGISWIKTILNKENMGFVRANNSAIEMAAPDSDIILLNNDIEIYDPKWIDKFQSTAYSDEKIGIAGCRIRRPNGMLQHAGTYMPDFTFWGQQIGGGEKDINQYNSDKDVEGVVFACVYIKSTVIEKIGKLSEDYLSYFEDTDYCLAAKQAGFRVVNCGSLTILHHEHVSTTINKINHSNLFLNSQKVFKKKWMPYLKKRLDRDICWHSTFNRPFGYGMISRSLAVSLEDSEIGVSYRYLYGPGTVFPVEEEPSNEDYRINIIRKRKQVNDAPQIIFGQGDAFDTVRKGYRVGFTMLETTGVPKQWVKQINRVDEVWTPSPFNAWTFQRSGVKKPICVMPLGVDTNYFNPRITGYPLNDQFTFLSIFEWGERKAPEILLKAFNQAFNVTDPVILICKFTNHDPTVDVNAQIESMNLDPEGGRVVFSVNQNVPYYQLGQLYNSADCFVLPTRGEGWGMPLLEAMACGLPVIAPFWSAQQFFMTDANSYPLQVEKLVHAEAKCPYYKGFKWVEPDTGHLKRLFRYVYENPDEAKKKGGQAAADVREKWSFELCGKRMRERIETIETERKEKGVAVSGIRYPGQSSRPLIGFDISRAIGEQVTGVGRAGLNLLKGLSRITGDENPYRYLLLPGLGDFVHPEYMKRFFAESIDDERFTLYRGPLPAFCDADHYVPGLNLVHSTAYMKPDTYGIPLIVTVHDLTFVTHSQFHTKETIRFCEKNMELAINSGCHFFADSKNTKNDMKRIYGIDAERISVIYIPIDTDTFYPHLKEAQLNIRKRYDLPERFFLYVGSLEPRKNIQSVLKSMQRYNGSEPLVVIGASGWKNSDLKDAFEECQNNVRLMGYIPQEDLPVFYSSALATVYPSLYEGFGLPVLESMACGTPVITSNNSSIPEVAGDACMLLDDPKNIDAISKWMGRLSEDENLRSHLSVKGIEQAKEFSLEKCALSAIREYGKMIESNRFF